MIWKAWRKKGTGWLYDTARMLFASPRDFLDAWFESAKLKTMTAAWGLHLDFAPDVAGYSHYKTPVGSLYMCRASTWPGAGRVPAPVSCWGKCWRSDRLRA